MVVKYKKVAAKENKRSCRIGAEWVMVVHKSIKENFPSMNKQLKTGVARLLCTHLVMDLLKEILRVRELY